MRMEEGTTDGSEYGQRVGEEWETGPGEGEICYEYAHWIGNLDAGGTARDLYDIESQMSGRDMSTMQMVNQIALSNQLLLMGESSRVREMMKVEMQE